jgi:hypothetical protein
MRFLKNDFSQSLQARQGGFLVSLEYRLPNRRVALYQLMNSGQDPGEGVLQKRFHIAQCQAHDIFQKIGQRLAQIKLTSAAFVLLEIRGHTGHRGEENAGILP